MSFEYYLTSNRSLPEINYAGQQLLTVRDMIRMNVPHGPVPWDEMDENAEVLYTNPEASNRFIVQPSPNSSKIMSRYTQLECIYKFDVSEMDFPKELFNYVTSLDKDLKIEIWHLWFGYDFEDEIINKKVLSFSTLSLSDFDVPHNKSWCIIIN